MKYNVSIDLLVNMNSWDTLPANCLQNIYNHLDVSDVKQCLGISKHWNFEANYYLKDKQQFDVSKVRKVKRLKHSKARFQHIMIREKRLKFAVLKYFGNMKLEDEILSTTIEFGSYKALSQMLKCLSGKHVKNLTLVKKNYAHDAFSHLDYGCLNNVENLQIIDGDNSLLNISKSFTNLKTCAIQTLIERVDVNLSEEILENFHKSNSSLERIRISSVKQIARDFFTQMLHEIQNYEQENLF